MKILFILLFIGCVTNIYSEDNYDMSGKWWRLKDELIIDENLGFTMKAEIDGKTETLEGQIYVIGAGNFYANVDYKGKSYNSFIYMRHYTLGDKEEDNLRDVHELRFTIYKDSIDIIGRGWVNEKDILLNVVFTRIEPVITLVPKEKKKNDFFFYPTHGSSSGTFNRSNEYNEYLLAIDIFSLNFIELDMGLYFEIIPAKYFYSFTNHQHMMSFLNMGLFWDILSLKEGKKNYELLLGPKISASWLNLYDFKSLDINNLIFNAGLKLGYGFLGNYTSIFSIETGYNNTNGRHGFYFSISIDNALPLSWPIFFWI